MSVADVIPVKSNSPKALRVAPSLDLFARFEAKVDRSNLFRGCHVWTGSLTSNGYGQFQSKRAHRVAYAFYHGEAPATLICHRCDNRACMRREHLWAGTNADNSGDMVAKGRWRGRFMRSRYGQDYGEHRKHRSWLIRQGLEPPLL